MAEATKPHCFAHNHMTCREYGLYTRVRELQSKFGFVWFDGEDLAEGFQKTPSSTVYKDTRTLIKAGWFEVQGAQTRGKNNQFCARKIIALSHKDWAAKYPSECMKLKDSRSISENDPCEPNGTDGTEPCESNGARRSISENGRSISENRRVSLIEEDMVNSRHGRDQTKIKADMVGGESKNADSLFDLEASQSDTPAHDSQPNSTAQPEIVEPPEPPHFYRWLKEGEGYADDTVDDILYGEKLDAYRLLEKKYLSLYPNGFLPFSRLEEDDNGDPILTSAWKAKIYKDHSKMKFQWGDGCRCDVCRELRNTTEAAANLLATKTEFETEEVCK